MPPAPRDIPGLDSAEACRDTLAKYGSIIGIAANLNTSENTVRRRFTQFQVAYDSDRTPVEYRRQPVFSEQDVARQRRVIRAKLWPDKPLDLLAIADAHTPEVCWPVLERAYQTARDRFGHWPDATMVIGDIVQNDRLSRFVRRKSMSWSEQRKHAIEFMAYVSAHSRKWALLIQGNHDWRPTGMIMRQLQADPEFAEEAAGELDMMRFLDKWSGPKIHTHYGWWIRLGNDLVCAHPDRWSKIPLRPGTTVATWFETWSYLFPDIKCLLMGHTHRWGQARLHDVAVVEVGAMAWPSDYIFARKLAAENEAWQYGCVTLRLLPDGSIEDGSLILHDLTPYARSLPDDVGEPVWDKPPAGLADQKVWPDTGDNR